MNDDERKLSDEEIRKMSYADIMRAWARDKATGEDIGRWCEIGKVLD